MEKWEEYLNELLKEQLDEVVKVEGPLNEITEEEVKAALKGMQEGKEAGPSGVPIDLLQAAGMVGSRELTNNMNDIIYEDWKSSTTIPIYKGKGDAIMR